jgi:hypothetical protein
MVRNTSDRTERQLLDLWCEEKTDVMECRAGFGKPAEFFKIGEYVLHREAQAESFEELQILKQVIIIIHRKRFDTMEVE